MRIMRLLTKNGNVVNYPGGDNGWIGSPGKLQQSLSKLNPNETYTAVARRKGDISPDPLSKLPDENAITANPGDMADAPKYIVEAKRRSCNG